MCPSNSSSNRQHLQCAGSRLPAARAQQDFSSQSQHYRLTPPGGWEQTSKQGANVLFQSPEEKGTNLGVTVTPVRIDSLAKFGSLDKVAERLLGVERGKVSLSLHVCPSVHPAWACTLRCMPGKARFCPMHCARRVQLCEAQVASCPLVKP